MNRRDFLKNCASVMAAGTLLSNRSLKIKRSEQPNIVLIYADDMGYGDVGYHGIDNIHTPNIDKLAASGMSFSQGYASASVCGPSRCGLLTGVYQQRYGCEANPPESGYPESEKAQLAGLPTTQPILSEMLKPAGYHCGIIGKWHLGMGEPKRPLNRGFDEFYGFLNGAHSYYESDLTFGEQHNRWPMFRNEKIVEMSGYLTDVFSDEAVDFIERNNEKPFFLYLAYNAVHSPWEVPDSYIDRLSHISGEYRRLFAAMVLAMDDGIGRVMQALKDEGLSDDTIVMFISDNGTPYGQQRVGDPASPEDYMSSTGPLSGFKGDTYEGGVRVPFIINWPGQLPPGKSYDLPVSTLDITPTITSFLGIDTPDNGFGFDGIDLLPYLTGENKARPHEILYWRRKNDYAIRKGDWKLAFNDGNPTGNNRIELFDLANDIGESDDVSQTHPEIVSELQDLFDEWDSQMPESS